MEELRENPCGHLPYNTLCLLNGHADLNNLAGNALNF